MNRDKNEVTNISTVLMYIRDIAMLEKVPINIYFDTEGLWIYITVGFGTPYQKHQSFYLQDTYRSLSLKDLVYEWIKEAIKEIHEMKGENYD